MEKLGLHHIAPYLIYGLMWKSEHSEIPTRMIGIDGEWVIFRRKNTENPKTQRLERCMKKPILRPLSDVLEGITVDGKHIDIIDHFKWIRGNVKELINREDWTTHILRPCEKDQLLQWHFDVFGLINAGLAIDINTLKATT